MDQRRIVVTGMGLVSPLGSGVEVVWQRLLEGRSGLRNLPEAVVADLPTSVGGRVPTVEEDAEAGFDPDRATPPKEQKKMDRFILFAMEAARQALEQAGWHPSEEKAGSAPRRLSARVWAGSGRLPMPYVQLTAEARVVCRPLPFLPFWSIWRPGMCRFSMASKGHWARR